MDTVFQIQEIPSPDVDALRVLQSFPYEGTGEVWPGNHLAPRTAWLTLAGTKNWGDSTPKAEVPASATLFSQLGGRAWGSMGMKLRSASLG